MKSCILIDWGTTNARSYLVADDGQVCKTRQSDLGILNVENSDFAGAFEKLTADWRETNGKSMPVLMSGMIGSRQGWAEAPYTTCPAAAVDLAANVFTVPDRDNIWIVPGICLADNAPRHDVMRGEEVQIFGALELAGCSTATLCLPGTHSKWAQVINGKLVDFTTAMTGEVYQLMCQHSILGALMSKNANHHPEAFARGLDVSATDGGLLSHLFSVRADALFDKLEDSQSGSYLSGLLIGHEIRELAKPGSTTGEQVLLVGSSHLAAIYADAFRHMNISFQNIDGEQASVKGLWSVWKSLSAEQREKRQN